MPQHELKNAYIGEYRVPGVNTIAYYPLSSTTTVNDQSGNNRNLTNSNVSFGTQFGVDCAYISGNADSSHSVSKYLYGNITGLPTGSSARTYSFWIYNNNASVPSAADDTYIFQGQASSNKMVFVIGGGVDSSSGLMISQRGSSGNFGASIRQQRCHNVITYDGTKFEWYVNGVSRGTWTYTINTGSNKFSIFGASENPAWNGFNGGMSELILEDRVRTAQEVANYYNQTKSDYEGWKPGANTIAYYPLTTNFNDASGNNRNLTNSGGTITTSDGVACAYFSGSSNVMASVSISVTTQDSTFACWMKKMRHTDNERFVHRTDDNIEQAIAGRGTQGQLNFINWQNGWRSNAYNSNTPEGQWIFVVGTWGSSGNKAYLNGVEQTLSYFNGNASSTALNVTYATIVLGNNRGGTQPGQCYLSNVIIENKVWTAQEVQDYYNQTKSLYGIS